MHERFAAHERDSHRPQIADFFDPKLEVFQLRMGPRVIVFGAIRAIEVAPISQVQAALERLAIEEPLARFEQIIAGKFPTDFIEQVHGVICGLRLYEDCGLLSSPIGGSHAPRDGKWRQSRDKINIERLGARSTYALEPRKVATGASWAARRAGT
jgi:hypothetical protein